MVNAMNLISFSECHVCLLLLHSINILDLMSTSTTAGVGNFPLLLFYFSSTHNVLIFNAFGLCKVLDLYGYINFFVYKTHLQQ